jgi:glycosyltransferase involved in cell wall biosynthesis
MINQRNILFLIRSLEQGGAERQLIVLAEGLSARGWKVTVITFYKGLLDIELKQKGIKILCLEKKGRWELLRFLRRLLSIVKSEDPLILHSYLTVGNIVATIIKLFIPKIKVVWGVRSSEMKLENYDWTAKFTDCLEAVLAWVPTLIIANSRSGQEYLVRRSFPDSKIIVIPNGIDTDRFCPDSDARQRVRAEWNVKNDEILVGLVARVDPIKDHPNFLQAAALVAAHYSNIRFICVGDGEKKYLDRVQEIGKTLGLEDRLIWENGRQGVKEVYNALDIAVSSSVAEGFSNTICEAMASGVPCVATDVGDAHLIIGKTGIIVPPQDAESLAKGIIKLISTAPHNSELIRDQIADNFSVESLVLMTEKKLKEYCFDLIS